MVDGICGYDLVVPEASYESGEPWIANAHHAMTLPLPQQFRERVRVTIMHISPTPGVLYSCVNLLPLDAASTVWRLHFHVDRRMTTKLCAGDLVHVRTTYSGGLAISILRDGDLLAAAGAVCKVPLGPHVIARYPGELFDEAIAVIRRRHPDFKWHETPVEVAARGESRLLLRARTKLGGYDVFMLHGQLTRFPSKDECLAISRFGSGLEVAANATAFLFNAPGHAGGPLRGERNFVQMSGSDAEWWTEHISTVHGQPEDS
jgi:hypothetical protein